MAGGTDQDGLLVSSNETLWSKYAEIRAESLRAERGLTDATEFYRQHQEEMDTGAVVAWRERFNHDELSAVQHAMNLRLQDERAFWAEYQNEPLPEESPQEDDLSADQIAAKINRLKRGDVPVGCNQLTMFIDVQGALLFYLVAAWEDDFTGYVIDYGAYPDQRRPYFTLRDARPTLSEVAKGAGLEGSIYAGLEELTGQFLGREWRTRRRGRHADRTLSDRRQLGLVDGGDLPILPPKRPCGFTPAQSRPVRRRIERALFRIQAENGRSGGAQLANPQRTGQAGRPPRGLRHQLLEIVCLFPPGGVHGRPGLPVDFWRPAGVTPPVCRAHHGRVSRETEGRGRTVDEWKPRAAAVENHWLDCLVGSAVAASIQGTILPGTDVKPLPKRPRVKLSELQHRRK